MVVSDVCLKRSDEVTLATSDQDRNALEIRVSEPQSPGEVDETGPTESEVHAVEAGAWRAAGNLDPSRGGRCLAHDGLRSSEKPVGEVLRRHITVFGSKLPAL